MKLCVGTEIEKAPFLTRDEEVDLSRRIQAGDMEARNTLVVSHLMYAAKQAIREWKRRGRRGDPEDIFQAAVIGLIVAARKFDAEKACFKTYSFDWIRHYIKCQHPQENIIKLDPDAFVAGCRPDGETSLTPESQRAARAALAGPTWGDPPIEKSWREEASPLTTMSQQEEIERMREAINGLSPRRKLIVNLRIEGVGFPEIARDLGVCHTYARKIYQKAITQLRRSLAGKPELSPSRRGSPDNRHARTCPYCGETVKHAHANGARLATRLNRPCWKCHRLQEINQRKLKP